MRFLCNACVQPFVKEGWSPWIPAPTDGKVEWIEAREDCPLVPILGEKHNVAFLRKSRLRMGDQSVYLEYGIDKRDTVQLMLRTPHGKYENAPHT
jgi:hypothetical protein